MKLRLSLKNSARAALNSLILPKIRLLTALLSLAFLTNCTIPSEPTYSLGDLSSSLVKMAQEEYKLPLVSTLVGQTLWIYLPLEEELFIDSDKPQEYTQRFDFKSAQGNLKYDTLAFGYEIRETPETKESQNKKFNPQAAEKINKVLRCVRRLIFSLKRYRYEPEFFVTVVTDTKNGIELIDVTYVDDLKKVLYEMISWVEYQHRNIEDIKISPEAVGDKEGKHLKLYDIEFKDFFIEQIKQRLRSKFSRGEVEKGADIDKEVLKSIKNVLEIYNFNDFSLLELKNLVTDKTVSFSRAAVLEKNTK